MGVRLAKHIVVFALIANQQSFAIVPATPVFAVGVPITEESMSSTSHSLQVFSRLVAAADGARPMPGAYPNLAPITLYAGCILTRTPVFVAYHLLSIIIWHFHAQLVVEPLVVQSFKRRVTVRAQLNEVLVFVTATEPPWNDMVFFENIAVFVPADVTNVSRHW